MKTNQELIESLQGRAAQLQACNELSFSGATNAIKNGAKTLGNKMKPALNKAQGFAKTAGNKLANSPVGKKIGGMSTRSKNIAKGLGATAAAGAIGYGAYRGAKRAAKDWRAESFYMPTYNGYTLVNEADAPKFGQTPSKFTKAKRAASDKLKAAGAKLKSAGSKAGAKAKQLGGKAKTAGSAAYGKAKTLGTQGLNKAKSAGKAFNALSKGKKAAIIGGGLAAAGAAGAGVAALKRRAKNESYTFNEKFSN